MNYRERIIIDPRIRSGKPCIRGTRIAEVLEDFPDLVVQDIQACFAWAADRERRLKIVPHEAAV
jgi:uncharacterized protein (DUF433 family)